MSSWPTTTCRELPCVECTEWTDASMSSGVAYSRREANRSSPFSSRCSVPSWHDHALSTTAGPPSSLDGSPAEASDSAPFVGESAIT